MAYIEIFDYENASDELRQAYDAIIGSRGKLAEVHKIQGLNPAALLAHMELYKTIMFGRSPLKRYQREMIAVIVSAANQCQYCIEHHKEALLFYWKDQARAERLLESPNSADLDEKDVALCDFANSLTLSPDNHSSEQVEYLRIKGLTDREILDATQVIAYFNFVNRMVLALGVSFNESEMKGYNY